MVAYMPLTGTTKSAGGHPLVERAVQNKRLTAWWGFLLFFLCLWYIKKIIALKQGGGQGGGREKENIKPFAQD